MSAFAKYNKDGLVIATGHMPDEMLILQEDNICVGDANIRTHYVLDRTLYSYTEEEQKAKDNLHKGWTWKMPERIAVDLRTTEKQKADTDQAILEARKAAYPTVEAQLDALWHAMDKGVLPKVEGFYDKIAAVKIAIPKQDTKFQN